VRVPVLRLSLTSSAAVLLAIAAAACAATVDGTNTARQAFRLTVDDPQGLVLAASSLPGEEGFAGFSSVGVHPLDDPNAIAVIWNAFPCQTLPSLELSQAEGDPIKVELDPGPRTGEFCASMSATYGVRLVLKEPADAEEIALDIVGSEEP
jgi:hypothetical protein